MKIPHSNHSWDKESKGGRLAPKRAVLISVRPFLDSEIEGCDIQPDCDRMCVFLVQFTDKTKAIVEEPINKHFCNYLMKYVHIYQPLL